MSYSTDIAKLKKRGVSLREVESRQKHGHGNWIWMRLKSKLRPNLHYYTVDLEVSNEAYILLHIFDMKHNVTGGKGDLLETVSYDYRDDKETKSDVIKFLGTFKYKLAKSIQAEREAERIALEIKQIQKDIFGR